MKIYRNAEGEMEVDINAEDLLSDKGKIVFTRTNGEKVVFDKDNMTADMVEALQDDEDFESVEIENKPVSQEELDDPDMKSGFCCFSAGMCCKGGSSFKSKWGTDSE